MPVFRLYVEKKTPYAVEAAQLLSEIRGLMDIKSVSNVRMLNRYDVEGMDEALFETCKPIVFFEPQLDNAYIKLPLTGAAVFAVESLPGQFDQRADSCAECIQLISQGERPTVRTARVYLLGGNPSEEEIQRIKKYVINPVESREASLEARYTLKMDYPEPEDIELLHGFRKLDRDAVGEFVRKYGLAMDADDLLFCQDYFLSENRDPTLTEIRMIDTYWSDHCRHTTFLTVLNEVNIEKERVEKAFLRYLKLRETVHEGKDKPITLMDIATIGAKYLKKQGKLPNLDVSEEINACSIEITVDVDGKPEPWLLMFKNETHNHPTEIEPFGGAATCIGGAIRDPLSGRTYVYQAMRVTGAADPLVPLNKTLPGKLPQRKLTTTAAAGYSSYGNQIGLATGFVDEIYHPGYVAKRMEIGAVLGAAPKANIRRETPAPGDAIVLLGGRTGRDGCGGATGSSKSHKLTSIETCGAEVQKGNAPTERKLQRLFRNPHVTSLIKRCNDFGAGGVSVAIGELADGLTIDLDAVPKKYEGLSGTELAISESQERMAVVLSPEDVQTFLEEARKENIEATVVACVKEQKRLTMTWRGKTIVDISREFLDSNGASKHAAAWVKQGETNGKAALAGTLKEKLTALMSDLNVCGKKGLVERFDSTIGAGTVVMPFGGKRQLTPVQAMAAKMPLERGNTSVCSGMAYGFNPYLMEQNPYEGAYLAVAESIAKLTAAGFSHKDAYLTFQEYFERLGVNPERWGKPLAALLGALDAQLDFGIAAIGGKDSMSGSFENLDVPPTLVSFAVAPGNAENVSSPEFKQPGHKVVLLSADPIADPNGFLQTLDQVEALLKEKKACSAWTAGFGGIAEGLCKMALGNQIGFALSESFTGDLFALRYGSFILELAEDMDIGETLGITTKAYTFAAHGETVDLAAVQEAWEGKLESVFPYRGKGTIDKPGVFSYAVDRHVSPKIGCARPKAFIPVFPGTNCEVDTVRALHRAGADADVFVLNNLSPAAIGESLIDAGKRIANCQMIVLPGGFSAGDEPDGSGKFITAFFRNPRMKDSVHDLLFKRDGLMLGICNGFQALIKLGLLPYGEIIDTDENCPTLTYNVIGRHQSMLVHTRIASNKSPWLSRCLVGDIHTIAVSHGEGRFVALEALIAKLAKEGQIATQYVDLSGAPSMALPYNPNGSYAAIEAITSLDGRILGKMGHTERSGEYLYKNVDGNKFQPLFEGGVDYFK
jgi:phosphoribosylformylglycinamidine synthase